MMKESLRPYLYMGLLCSIITFFISFSPTTLLNKILLIVMPWSFSFGMMYLINRLGNKKPNSREVERK